MPDALRPQQLLAAILELTGEAVLSIGIDGIIEEWSPGAEVLYGYTAAEMKGTFAALRTVRNG
jgi:PAS domain S-box-containing protein